MALVNAYKIWCQLHRTDSKKRSTRSKFYYTLTEGIFLTLPFEGGRVTRASVQNAKSNNNSTSIGDIVGELKVHNIFGFRPKRQGHIVLQNWTIEIDQYCMVAMAHEKNRSVASFIRTRESDALALSCTAKLAWFQCAH